MRVDITPWDTAAFDSNTIAARVQMSDYAGFEYQIHYHSRVIRLEDVSEIRHRLTDDAVIVHFESGLDIELKTTDYDIYVEGVQYLDGETLEAKLAQIAFGASYVAP